MVELWLQLSPVLILSILLKRNGYYWLIPSIGDPLVRLPVNFNIGQDFVLVEFDTPILEFTVEFTNWLGVCPNHPETTKRRK